MLNTRQLHILKLLIRSYIADGEPVGSAHLVKKCRLPVSSATVRNDFTALEKEGYISQPHLSSGRIPTEKGFRYFADHASAGKLSARDLRILRSLLLRGYASFEDGIHALAKGLAELSSQGIIVGTSAHTWYSTGLRNLFAQPEFAEPEVAIGLGEIVDRLEETAPRLFEQDFVDDLEVRVGRENPFAPFCGLVAMRYRCAGGREGVLGIFGPIRMDYERAMALIRVVKEMAERMR